MKDLIFAGLHGGRVFLSNNGTSWTALNNGLTNLKVLSLYINVNTLFAGTEGRKEGRKEGSSVFKLDMSTIPIINFVNDRSKSRTLCINTIRGNITVSYTLASTSLAQLHLYTFCVCVLPR
jgi:hypothetical protein